MHNLFDTCRIEKGQLKETTDSESSKVQINHSQTLSKKKSQYAGKISCNMNRSHEWSAEISLALQHSNARDLTISIFH